MESAESDLSITSTLACFQGKIKEAIALVQSMSTEDKLKAVQYWNVVSENLQDVVNSSADDITALASQLSERENLIAQEQFKLCSSQLPQYQRPILQHTSTYHSNSANHSHHPRHTRSQGIKVFQQNQDDVNHTALFDLEQKQADANVIGTDLLDHYLVSQPTMTAASDGQHSLSVMVDPSNTFTPGVGLRGTVPIPTGSPTMTVNTLAIEETLDVQRDDHVDGDDPLPLSDVPFTAEESEGFSVDDLGMPVSPALGNNVSNSVGLVTEDENVAGSSVDLRKYLTIAKNKRGAAVLNFFTKQARDPEAKGSDCHVYCCNVCQKSYPSIGSFYYHFAIHSKPFTCQKCGESCHSRAHLRTHMQCHGAPCQNKCKECGREFTTFSNLNRHMKTHTGDRPFECTVCNKRFREKKSLQIHGRVHSGERPYQCDICASRFVQLGALNAHRETHADIRRHLCDLCGKSFRQKVQLKMHTLRHEGKKGFQCEKCPMAFNVLNDLKRHRRSHMLDKPFKCDECGKSFPRQQALTEHLNRHYGNRPYQCPFCTKSYPEMSACKKHIKTHEGSKPSGSSQTSTGESAVALPVATSR